MLRFRAWWRVREEREIEKRRGHSKTRRVLTSLAAGLAVGIGSAISKDGTLSARGIDALIFGLIMAPFMYWIFYSDVMLNQESNPRGT